MKLWLGSPRRQTFAAVAAAAAGNPVVVPLASLWRPEQLHTPEL